MVNPIQSVIANVEGNDETLYLLLNDEEGVFTDVTTDNEYYANPVKEEE